MEGRLAMDPLTAARIQTARDHTRLEESDRDGVITTFAHPRYDRRAVMTALGLD
jgi:hypothetical protein